jgi:hypothetical protein
MAAATVCPRCGARGSFMKGYLPETCVCRQCQSQLDWREIPGCGPDCRPAKAPKPCTCGGETQAGTTDDAGGTAANGAHGLGAED